MTKLEDLLLQTIEEMRKRLSTNSNLISQLGAELLDDYESVPENRTDIQPKPRNPKRVEINKTSIPETLLPPGMAQFHSGTIFFVNGKRYSVDGSGSFERFPAMNDEYIVNGKQFTGRVVNGENIWVDLNDDALEKVKLADKAYNKVCEIDEGVKSGVSESQYATTVNGRTIETVDGVKTIRGQQQKEKTTVKPEKTPVTTEKSHKTTLKTPDKTQPVIKLQAVAKPSSQESKEDKALKELAASSLENQESDDDDTNDIDSSIENFSMADALEELSGLSSESTEETVEEFSEDFSEVSNEFESNEAKKAQETKKLPIDSKSTKFKNIAVLGDDGKTLTVAFRGKKYRKVFKSPNVGTSQRDYFEKLMSEDEDKAAQFISGDYSQLILVE